MNNNTIKFEKNPVLNLNTLDVLVTHACNFIYNNKRTNDKIITLVSRISSNFSRSLEAKFYRNNNIQR